MLRTLLLALIPFLVVIVGYQALTLKNNQEGVTSNMTEAFTPTPQILKDLEELSGYKEDESIGPKKTLYVFYDPTCPGCHTIFQASLKELYKDHGITIKWLPTTILGDEEYSLSAAIYGLSANSKEQQARIFSREKPKVEITPEGAQAVATNNEYLKTYSAMTASILAVPTVLYMNQQGSNVTISYNINDDDYLLKIIDGV